jgi:hypothetical protein
MRELIEFRIPEEHAARWLSDSDGITLGGSVRKIELEASDARMSVIAEAEHALRRHGRSFFTAWTQRRTYADAELESATLLRLKISAVFEPSGEAGGTKYDESGACQHCCAGATQLGPLFLDVKRIPKGKDFAKTIAGEIVISRRASDLLLQHGITGVAFHAVRSKGAKSMELSEWSQLVVISAGAEIVAPTRAGNDPFDNDPKGEFRCPKGDLLGLNLLSEVFISSESRGEADVVASRQFTGVRRGSLRPQRSLFVSPKLWRLIDSERLTGCEIEVAHLV